MYFKYETKEEKVEYIQKEPLFDCSLRKIRPISFKIQEFSLKLKLKEALCMPLCKGKYFRFQVQMMNPSNMNLLQCEVIKLEAKLYNTIRPCREITKSMNGADILEGTKRVELRFDSTTCCHVASFKLKINDLSTNFAGICLSIQDCDSDFIQRSGLAIKPLIIQNLDIKSKEKICKKFRQLLNN